LNWLTSASDIYSAGHQRYTDLADGQLLVDRCNSYEETGSRDLARMKEDQATLIELGSTLLKDLDNYKS
jgi:hypothetical protein